MVLVTPVEQKQSPNEEWHRAHTDTVHTRHQAQCICPEQTVPISVVQSLPAPGPPHTRHSVAQSGLCVRVCVCAVLPNNRHAAPKYSEPLACALFISFDSISFRHLSHGSRSFFSITVRCRTVLERETSLLVLCMLNCLLSLTQSSRLQLYFGVCVNVCECEYSDNMSVCVL